MITEKDVVSMERGLEQAKQQLLVEQIRDGARFYLDTPGEWQCVSGAMGFGVHGESEAKSLLRAIISGEREIGSDGSILVNHNCVEIGTMLKLKGQIARAYGEVPKCSNSPSEKQTNYGANPAHAYWDKE